MAKKKASSKSSNVGLILKVLVLALGVAAFCMAFVTCVKFVTSKGDVVKAFSGFNEIIGYSETETVLGAEVKAQYLGFSFMALLTFLLPLVGACLFFVKNKMARLVGVALMLVGAVLMFLLPQFAVLATVDGELTLTAAILDACETSLGIGAILGGVFSALGAVVAGYAVLTKK